MTWANPTRPRFGTWKVALGCAGITGFRWHDWRHYAEFRVIPIRERGKEANERQTVETLARPERLELPATWFEVTPTNSTFEPKQSLVTLAAFAKPT